MAANIEIAFGDKNVTDMTRDELLVVVRALDLQIANMAPVFAERQRLESILNTPMVEPFLAAAKREAAHQVYRWGEQHDVTKTAWDWFWLLGYLGSKAAHAALSRDWDKAKHHTITAAAMLANWHRHICVAAETTEEVHGE